ncbi:MAG: hypothetical protein NTZ43_06090 [Gemmatimonadetes bacterium]|nr:hypothetical protein [Gemmatimonadota bacterium]
MRRQLASVARRAAAGCALAAFAHPLAAQEALLPSTGWASGLTISAWHLSTALPQSGGGLVDVAEVSVPFRVRSVFGRWSMDVSGAGTFGAVHFTSSPSSSGQGSQNGGGDGGDRAVTIAGPTDVKLRVTGPLYGDALLFTAGLNLPTGKVGLTADETSALQIIGAPALRMPVAALGTGTGVTLGVLRSFQGEDWSVALGASVEQRSEYSPIALALAAGRAETKITPGTAAHITLGLDRTLGEARLSAMIVGDVFSKDQVRQSGANGTSGSDYQLGPQITAFTRLDFGASGWRESALSVAVRQRSQFTDATGVKVTGSSGTYVEGALGGVLGGADGAGLILSADARWQSGLKFTDALVGAAATAAGVTLGVERAGQSTLTRFYVHGQYGSFDTGKAKSTGFGATLGISMSARREAK